MTIDEHIIANDVLREVKELLPSPFLKLELETQTAKGLVKYPNLVNVDDYDVVGWINHNIQELIDSTVYYKLAIKRIRKDYQVEFKYAGGVHVHAIAILEREIQNNIEKLKTLELLRAHYLEESK